MAELRRLLLHGQHAHVELQRQQHDLRGCAKTLTVAPRDQRGVCPLGHAYVVPLVHVHENNTHIHEDKQSLHVPSSVVPDLVGHPCTIACDELPLQPRAGATMQPSCLKACLPLNVIVAVTEVEAQIGAFHELLRRLPANADAPAAAAAVPNVWVGGEGVKINPCPYQSTPCLRRPGGPCTA